MMNNISTKIEALHLLQEIENIIVEIYTRRLDGEEIQPYIIMVQRYRKQLEAYLLEQVKEMPQRKEVLNLLKEIESITVSIYDKRLYGDEMKPYIIAAQDYKQHIERYIKEHV